MEKKKYGEITALLPEPLKTEVTAVKEYVKTLKNIKVKQKVNTFKGDDPYYQIMFTSEYGFALAIDINKDINEIISRRIYIISYNSHTQQRTYGVRKKNYLAETLDRLAEESPGLSDMIFGRLKSCPPCWTYPGCLHGVVVSHKNQRKRTCGASISFGGGEDELGALKAVLKAMDDVYGTARAYDGQLSKIIYELPMEPAKWESECADGLCRSGTPEAFASVESNDGGLIIRPSAAAPNDRPFAACFPENVYLERDTHIAFDFTSETKWRICLTLSDGGKTRTIDFQAVIGSVPAGYDGCAGRHCGHIRLSDFFSACDEKVKLERVDISSTWWINASKLTIDKFIFGMV